jgi:hypothetical protein
MIVNDMFTVGHPAYCGLGATEVKWLLPAAKKVYEKFKKKFEYYQGIHEGGEATPRQDTLMGDYEDNMRSAKFLVDEMEDYIEKYDK